ncbi:MAG: hypothetical protein H6724_10810 [Sandaracinus sp.]|nr:hypothetical protein [Sandaracinus sp.]MCB9619924.1 hypothetical protein [Sandaracinus sp.]MCB9624943.1 hypothetical protein [Sandaracinus sp.]
MTAAPDPAAPDEAAAKLAKAEHAFEVGDFGQARALARALRGASDAEVRERASALAKKLSIDPVQIGVLVACTLFFGWVVARYVF